MFQCIIQPRYGLVHNTPEMKGVFPDVRTQLNEQLRCLDARLECHQGQLTEIQDVFRRRAEIELNYSKDLEKLSKLLTSRHKEQKLKRDGWSTLSSTAIWKQLVAETKKAGKDHASLAEIYNNNITVRCSDIHEDITRMYKKCREIGFEIHEEILKVLHELHTAMKTNHTYQSEFRLAESKLAVVEKQRSKLKDQIPKEKLEKSRKFRLIEKEVLKRKTKYTEARLKATKARNEYLLCMDAANASLHKYYVDDLSDLIDCMDYGLHQSLARAVLVRSDAIKQVRKSEQLDIDAMEKILSVLDSRLDKKKFLEKNESAFMVPKKFEYQPVRRDETELVQKPVVEELESRKKKLADRISSLRAESEEIWKSLEAAEKSLNEMVSCADYDTTRYFVEEESTRAERDTDATSLKQRVARQETEQFYLQKFREYILNSNRISRLQAKYENIRESLGDQSGATLATTLPRPIANTRRRIGRTLIGGQPKLFGGSLEEYLESSHQDIPQIIKSCVRIINLYGLHHQGIFRVSGSQVEINNFREAFERGEDPLADMTDANDINSVAGVLKLYLRQLREPVFSVQYFDQFMELARDFPLPHILNVKEKFNKKRESTHEFVVKVRELVKSWPRPVYVVMRYLFAFLQHLSMSSDENLMDPYNLAICFGPTLVPIPADRDQVLYQNLVNELIKNFIIFNEDIFPNDGQGTVYEKYISNEPDLVGEFDNDDTEMVQEDEDEQEATDDDSVFREEEREDIKDISIDCFGKSEMLEATAQYDFTARSSREVSFTKGDTILLYCQASSDWWRGCVNGREGLVPDKYILIKIRGEDDPRDSLASISDGLDRRRISSQTDTIRSTKSEQSPRFQRPNHSVSVPPDTPPLSRAPPHRHSISHAPGSHLVTQTGQPTVISVQTQYRPRSQSRDSLEQDSGIPGSEVTSSDRASRSPAGLGSESDSRSLEFDSLSVDEANDMSNMLTSDATISADTSGTTVIHVSGGPSSMSVFNREILDRHNEEEDRETFETEAPSFGIPLDDSQVGSESKCDNSSSQDSLVSTGSNEKLKSELENTLACVKAVVEEVVNEKEKTVNDEVEMVAELASLPAGSRLAVGRKLSNTELETLNSDSLLGARPRATPRTSKTITGEQDGILLKQNSWGSRFGFKEEPSDETSNTSSFLRRKDLWERRSISTPSNNEDDRPSGFRGNRDFWQSKTTPRSQKPPAQAPDLVLDLPTGPLASSPPIPAPRPIHFRRSRSPSSDSVASNQSSSSESPARNSVSLTAADNFAADTDTLKKTQAAQNSTPTSVFTSTGHQPRPRPLGVQQTPRSQLVSVRSPVPRTPNPPTIFSTGLVATPQTPFSSQSGSFKPAVKVKPILQVKPSEVKKDSTKESE